MSKLTAAVRNKLPKREFALPAERKYPIENKSHARNAKARASEMANRGTISKAVEERIDARANKVLHREKRK
jgi:hypothetical protein